MPRIWVEVCTAECTCRLVNRSDESGWEMEWRDSGCPVHGDDAVSFGTPER